MLYEEIYDDIIGLGLILGIEKYSVNSLESEVSKIEYESWVNYVESDAELQWLDDSLEGKEILDKGFKIRVKHDARWTKDMYKGYSQLQFNFKDRMGNITVVSHEYTVIRISKILEVAKKLKGIVKAGEYLIDNGYLYWLKEKYDSKKDSW